MLWLKLDPKEKKSEIIQELGNILAWINLPSNQILKIYKKIYSSIFTKQSENKITKAQLETFLATTQQILLNLKDNPQLNHFKGLISLKLIKKQHSLKEPITQELFLTSLEGFIVSIQNSFHS